MDKYTIVLKIDEIRRLIDKKQYEKAIKILDTLDISKIRIITDLSVFADVFEHNKRYDKAIEILLRIYDKAKTRRALFQLAKVYAKKGDFEEAEKYYAEFVEIASKDSNRYILRYKIDKAEKKPLEVLVRDLETFKEYEYVEEWAYELAKLYHKSGYSDQCIRECSDIVLWFGEGLIVEKAKLLKAYYVGDNERIKAIKMGGKPQKATETNNMPITEQKTWNVLMEQDFEKQVKLGSAQMESEDTLATGVQLERVETAEDIVQEAIETETAEDIMQEAVETEIAEDIIQEAVETETAEEIVQENMKSDIDDLQLIKKQVKDVKHFIVKEEIRINNVDVNKMMKNFMEIPSVYKQLAVMFRKIKQEDSYKHLIITGMPYSGKTYLAKLFTRSVYQLGFISTPKLAMITGEKLNRINLEEKQDKLADGCVIIEKAGKMNRNTVDSIIHMMESYEGNIIVVLEDNHTEMKRLVLENRKLADYIHHSIELPRYSDIELMGFAKNYLEEQNFIINADIEKELSHLINWIEEQEKDEKLQILIQILSRAKQNAVQRDGEVLNLQAEDFLLEFN